MRRKIFISLLSVAVVFVLFALAAWFGFFTPTAPAGWSQIHVGMSREDVLRVAGTPSVSGWPEKVVETWQRDGAVCRHRLVVGYSGQQVSTVCDGTWLRGFGWLHPRIESQ